ncbi:hypothetical protein BX070DRAFT_244440 [Coemansia spiralis]|nr:hypothetical protein BX070DRAFT_244440 [Coemansia spiralis]
MAVLDLHSPVIWISAAVFAIGISVLYQNVGHALNVLGIGKTYTSVNTTSCHQIGIGVLHGCEDIVVDPNTGLAYLACGSLKPRQHWLHPDDEYDLAHESEADHVYIMDENGKYSDIKLLETASNGSLQPLSQDFRVHGFDIYWDPHDPQDMTFIFINHQLVHNAVSIFSYRHGSHHMVHVETVHSDLLHSPNNVLAMSKRAFYATNDMKYTRGIMREISIYAQLPHGHVVYRNEDGLFSVAAANIRYPNGIAKYKTWIYVASCTDPGVHIYKEDGDGKLSFQGRIVYSDGVPDNLFVDPGSGQLYSTLFLKSREVHKYFKHPSLNTTRVAATKIVRLTQRNTGEGFDIESLLIDSGDLMPTATIAAIQRRNQIRRMLIGCAMCNALVVCSDVA